ncbi:MAG: hypothetical protein J6N52_08285 [Clostridia bacterium]|nr:hypothetical protein [Clostridia bacterium]
MIYKKIVGIITGLIALTFTVPAVTADAGGGSEALTAFGICEYHESDETVTRSQLAEIAVKICFGTDYEPECELNFADVDETEASAGFISAAVQSSLMRIDGSSFRPSESVSVLDAACILTRISGFEYIIEQYGGYPNGYLYVMEKYDMLDNISADRSGKLTYKTLDRLFLNLLDMPYGKKFDVVNGVPVYSIEDSKTVLTEVFKMEKVTGIVFGNGKTTLNGVEPVSENSFYIGDYEYEDTNKAFQDLLGYNADAYVTDSEKTGEDRVIYALQNNKKFNAYSVSAEDIDSARCTVEQFAFEHGARRKTLTIDKRADCIYNGVALIPWSARDICPEFGEVKLLDNTGDGKIDIIFVDEYVNYFVESAGSVTNIIKDRYDMPDIKLDPDDDDLSYSIKYFGIDKEISDIAEGNVLTVRMTKNSVGRRFVDIQISTDFVEGDLKGKDEEWITVGTQTYKYDKRIEEYLNGKISGRFYLDVFGRVAGVSNEFSGGSIAKNRYAYIYKAHTVDEGEEYIKVYLVDLNGKVLELRAADNVSLKENGATQRLGADKVFLSGSLYSEGKFVPQLIMYDTNANGEINAVYIARNDTSAASRDTDTFSLDVVLGDDYWYSYWNQLISYNITQTDINTCYVSENTNILMLPRSIFDGVLEEKDVKVLKSNRLPINQDGIDKGYADGKMYYSDAQIYDCDNLNVASVMVLFKDNSEDPDKGNAWNENTDVFVVSEVSATMNDDAELCYCIKGSIGLSSDAVMYTTEDTTDIMSDAKPGDIYRIARDESWRYITHAQKVFSLKTSDRNILTPENIGYLSFGNSDKDKAYCRVSMIVGDVVNSKDGILSVEANYDSGKQTYFIQSYSNIIIMDTAGKGVDVSFGTTADITSGARVFLNTREHIIRDIVIFRD